MMQVHRTWSHEVIGKIECFDYCGGVAVGFSERSPAKETPNEDAAGLFSSSDQSGILVVADGVGGASCGDRAAITTINKIELALKASPPENSVRSCIIDAIESANEEIISWGNGADATLAVVVYSNGLIRPIHIGDATVLLFSNRGRIKYSTVAHAPVAMAVELGVINEDEAIMHEDRNLITNCVGSREMRIELGPSVKMAARDTLVVASDGLFDNFTPDDVAQMLKGGKLPKCAEQIAKSTRLRMTGENESVPSKPDDLTFLCFRQHD